MKQIFSIALMAAASLGAAAQSATPKCAWGYLFDGETTSGDQCMNNCVSTDGNLYWEFTAGTTHTERWINYAGEQLFEGGDYDPNGTSVNQNLAILKTDKEGKLLWKAYSNTCDFTSGEGGVTAMPDGAVAFAADVRSSDLGNGVNWEPLVIVDGKGTEHKFEWTVTEQDTKRYNKLVIGYFSADGELKWLREVVADRTPLPSATGTYLTGIGNAVKIGSGVIASDAQGNFYIGINYRTTTTVEGWATPLTATNNKTWTGDPQTNCGDVAIIKYNASGDVLKVLTMEGEATMEHCIGLDYTDGGLYAVYYLLGSGNAMTLGDKTFTPQGFFSPVVVKLDTDLNPTWITAIRGEKKSTNYGFQNVSVNACGDNLWFVGQFNGQFYDGDKLLLESVTPSVREGFLLKMDAANGACVQGTTSRASGYHAGLTGYFNAFEPAEQDGKVYIYGYSMTMKPGVFIRSYSTSDLATDTDSEWMIVAGATMPTCQAFSYDSKEGMVFTSARGKGTFTTLDGPSVGPASNWGILCTGFNMPEDFQTAVGSVLANSGEYLTIYGGHGEILVSNSSSEVQPVCVYDLSGKKVAACVAEEGTTSISLPAGFYITAGRKVIVK